MAVNLQPPDNISDQTGSLIAVQETTVAQINNTQKEPSDQQHL